MTHLKIRRFLIILLLLAALIFLACDLRLQVREYTITTDKVSSATRFLLITDLHSSQFGKNQKTLLAEIDALKPDVIVLVGDILDDRAPQAPTLEFLDGIRDYPSFYVTGNHEYRVDDSIEVVKELFRTYGVRVLSNESVLFQAGEDHFTICGLDDPASRLTVPEMAEEAFVDTPEDSFTLLLSHRPELIGEYNELPCDAVFSGHAHGGQFRIPYLLNGLLAPGQGLFPKYAGGLYYYGSRKLPLVVSRGLSKTSPRRIPRIFNRPELVLVTVQGE